MKCKPIIVVITLISSVLSANLDPYLLQHAIYGKSAIITVDICSTPQSGIVGTPGVLKSGNTMNMQTEVRFGTGDGGWKKFKVLSDSVFFQSVNSNAFNVVSGDTVRTTNVYPVQPVMPTYSETYTGTIDATGDGLTFTPGQYNMLSTNNGDEMYLEAGIYHFKSVLLESDSKVIIKPDANGNYATKIYVEGSFQMKNQSYLQPDSIRGNGKIALIATGYHTQFSVISPSYITATVIAPDIKVVFNSGSIIVGQLFADTVSLNKFDGGVGLDYVPLNQVNIIPETKSFLESDGDTSLTVNLADPVPDSNGTISWSLVDGTATMGVDILNSHPFSGILTYLQGDTVATSNIPLEIFDDNIYEGDETIILKLYNPSSNIVLSADTLFIPITIIDNDPQNSHPPVILSDTIFCLEGGNVTYSPSITDPD